jgi:hypothetical protein
MKQLCRDCLPPASPGIRLHTQILGPSLRWDDGIFDKDIRHPSEGWDPDN